MRQRNQLVGGCWPAERNQRRPDSRFAVRVTGFTRFAPVLLSLFHCLFTGYDCASFWQSVQGQVDKGIDQSFTQCVFGISFDFEHAETTSCDRS